MTDVGVNLTSEQRREQFFATQARFAAAAEPVKYDNYWLNGEERPIDPNNHPDASPRCWACHGTGYIEVAGPDENGMYDVDECRCVMECPPTPEGATP